MSGYYSGFSFAGDGLTCEEGDHMTYFNVDETLFLQSLAFKFPLSG